MFFGEVLLQDALNCYLAHSQLTPQGRLRKGTLLSATHLQQLAAAGLESVTVARPGDNDVHENRAATLIANALSGVGVNTESARTGRVNLYARQEGLFCFDRERVLAINSVSPGITIATLSENLWVSAGRLIATVKIIPYAVPAEDLDTVLENQQHSRPLSVIAAQEARAHLIQTTLPGISENMLDKSREVTRLRLLKRNAALASETRCQHEIAALTQTIITLTQGESCDGLEWILITGASAISDIEDVIPAAITAAGGEILRYGLPVDPGNLLLLGRLDQHWIVGLPGCARSSKYNGFDQILDRMACRQTIDDPWLDSLSVGGLMGEILERPSPRIPQTRQNSEQATVGVVLAAGSSRRFGPGNKLLATKVGDDQTLVWRVLHSLLKSSLQRIVVVTGHQRNAIEQHLRQHYETYCADNHQPVDDERLCFVYNKDYAHGMASSLQCAIAPIALNLERHFQGGEHPSTAITESDKPTVLSKQPITPEDAVLVCLADMPDAQKQVIEQLIAARQTHPEFAGFVPTYQSQQGNPVLLTSGLFDAVLALQGDVGARAILNANAPLVMKVAVENRHILVDYDKASQLSTDAERNPDDREPDAPTT